jgi:hypothetical protein
MAARRCGGVDGVGQVPLIRIDGACKEREHTTYNVQDRCPLCGAVSGKVIDIVFA